MPGTERLGQADAVAYDGPATMGAWESFLSDGGAESRRAAGIRSLIRDSWCRSASCGIDALGDAAPLTESDDLVERLRRANQDLWSAAQKSFAQFARLLEGTEAMLILTDKDGVIIDTIGDGRTLDDGREIHLEIGGVWAESAVGTNGIGTALWTGEPVFVHAAEHFCAGIKAWTCAGAPIRDPFDDTILGVIDLSGPTSIFRRHNTALVTAAAREIQAALAERQNEERARLLEACIDTAPAGRPDDDVVILDHLGRVIYARRAPQRERPGDAGITLGRRLLALSGEMSDADIHAALPPMLKPSGVTPLRLDGEVRGAVLVFAGGSETPPRMPAAAAPGPATPAIGARAGIVGESQAILAAIDLARRVARSNASVLVEGETGVGKELFARLIHAEARRAASDPFVAVNCGAIAKELFGGELFGHVAGAFTGAVREGKPGKFELADGGVLCLDEIGEMPLDLQPYLLRVLEERAVYRLGDNKRRPVEVRLVALTNRDLKSEVEAGRFRRDLYYRISAVTIRVPPLRERGHDIVRIAEHFNHRFAAECDRDPLRLSGPVIEALLGHPWPGNVRELRNVVERLHLLAAGPEIAVADLPDEIGVAGRDAPPDTDAESLPVSLEDAERATVMRAIAATDGNLSRTAKTLGISRPTLYRKMRLYGIRRTYG